MVLSLFLSFSPPPFCVTFCLPHCLSAFPPLLSSLTFLVSPTPSSLIFLFSNLVSCRFSFKDHGSHSSLSILSLSPCHSPHADRMHSLSASRCPFQLPLPLFLAPPPPDNMPLSKPSLNEKRQGCPTVTPARPWEAFSVQDINEGHCSDLFKLNLAKRSSCGAVSSTSSNNTGFALLARTRGPAQPQPYPKGHLTLPRRVLQPPFLINRE